MRHFVRPLGVLAVLATAACSAETGPNISGVPAFDIRRVEVTPVSDTMFIPDTVRTTDRLQLRATAFGMGSEVLPVGRFVWASSDTTIAVVDENGLLTPRRTGAVEISASATRVGRAQIIIRPASRRLVVTRAVDTIFVDEPATTLTDSLRFRAQALDSAGRVVTGVRFSWQSSAPNIAAIDSTGLVRALSFGPVTITVTGNGAQTTANLLVRPRVERVEFVRANDTLFVDDPISAAGLRVLTPRAFDLAGNDITSSVRFTWSSAAPSVATVDSLGRARALTLGSSAITLRAALSQSTGVLHVLPVVREVRVASPVTQVLDGDTVQLSATALNYSGDPVARPFAWTSSNPTVATVSGTGRVTFLSTGSATFTATTAFRSATVAITALPRELLAVTAGKDFACGYAALGRGYCWGIDSLSQLGSGADSTCLGSDTLLVVRREVSTPCAISPKQTTPGAATFSVIDAGKDFACGVSPANLLYCWGYGELGQIGNGRTVTTSIPSLTTVRSERFRTVSAGGAHACGLTLSGRAFCWGIDSDGQLGDNRQMTSTTPIPVVKPDGYEDDDFRLSAISAGDSHTCAIDSQSAQAYCWGRGDHGQLGDGGLVPSDVPVLVQGGIRFARISAGDRHSCGVSTGGSLYCWGRNNTGQLSGNGGSVSATPVLVGSGYIDVSAGTGFTCAITSGGEIRCFGANDYGQLGRGESNPRGMSGTVSPIVGGRAWRSVAAGSRTVCAIDTLGDTYCWGSNLWGALGNSLQAAVRATPQRLARLR